jgi:hypothetical protein
VDDRSRHSATDVKVVVMTNTPFSPKITTQASLQEAWRHLMGPWSFGGQSVWMMLIVDDRPVPQLIEITESEEPPEVARADLLSGLLSELERELAPGARFAFLRSRPGVGVITELDRTWAMFLYAAARHAGVESEVVHLATRDAIRPIPYDDVGVSARSA